MSVPTHAPKMIHIGDAVVSLSPGSALESGLGFWFWRQADVPDVCVCVCAGGGLPDRGVTALRCAPPLEHACHDGRQGDVVYECTQTMIEG